jgi:cob(I)alamin adenosyltransferase
LPYLNRLSDWFFTIARYLLVSSGTPEILWVKAADRG